MELIDRIAARFNAHDVDGFVALFSEDGELYEQDGTPHLGRESIRATFTDLFILWSEISVTHRECFDYGDKVVWLAEIDSRARSVDLRLSAPFSYAIELRGDLIARMRIFPEDEAAFRALGLDPPG